jgi:hypothetical protein
MSDRVCEILSIDGVSVRKFFTIIVIMLIVSPIVNRTYAWIYPEHRDITLRGIKMLSPNYREKLDELWKLARTGHESRLFDAVIDETNAVSPRFIDFAAFPAISGDHSVSAKDMLNTVLNADWILEVAEITNELKINLAESWHRDSRNNALRNSDLLLQRSDPAYATRAGHNNVHFLLSLNSMVQNEKEYFWESVKPGAELNAIGVFVWYHYSALLKASLLTSPTLSGSEKSELILSALADEAFALHFLEDILSSGHVAGTWGDASQKKGSHDYYDEYGLKTTTWDGESIVLVGDAWMREEDLERTAKLVKMSMEELIDAFSGVESSVMAINDRKKSFEPDDFNVAKTDYMPLRELDPKLVQLVKPILYKAPVPGLNHGLGELPRFRAELGAFSGVSASLNSSLLSRSFGEKQDYPGALSGIDLSVKFGVGLDGVLSDLGDGLMFVGFGIRSDGPASSGIVDMPGTEAYGNLLSSIPSRSAYSVRFRVPFYLIPGDLIVAAPFLLVLSPSSLVKMAAFAANGGIIPWQSGISTPIGRFQFILGREVSVQLFGRTRNKDVFLQQATNPSGETKLALASYRTTRIEFPILEYRPFRTFATDQSSKLFLQLYGGVDIPHNVELSIPSALVLPKFENVWYFGLRLAFDWRYYY